MQSPELYIAFLAGLLSFLSPCVLPLVPAYIGYLGGSAVRSAQVQPAGAAAAPRPRPGGSGRPVEARAGAAAGGGVRTTGSGSTAAMSSSYARWIVLLHALIFVLGFTFVFAIIGGLLGSLRDVLLSENPIFHISNRRILQYIMGVLLVVFGLHMVGLINVPFLNYERRLGDKLRPSTNLGYIRSFLIGLGFGLGWTPCIGPTLGLIFGLALNGQQGDAILPFLFYSIGLGVPFLLTALAMGRISAALKRLTRRSYTLRIGNWTAIDRVNIVSLVSGGLLILMGILIFGNWLTLIAPSTPGIGNL